MTNSKGPKLFPETVEKDVLRLRGLHLLQDLADLKQRALRYVGLPGREALDVLKWREVLSHVRVVERPIRDPGLRLDFEDAIYLRLTPIFNGNVEIVYGDIWDYLGSAEFAATKAAPDVVNLDFCGGLVYADMEYPVQRKAFQGLFARAQRDAGSFVLFLTLMPRDKGGDTYRRYLNGHVAELRKVANFTSTELSRLDANIQFHSGSNFRLFKACMPIMIEDIGRAYNFHVRLAYLKRYTKMLHMALVCTFEAGTLGLAASPVSVIRILQMPLRKLLPDGLEDREVPPVIRSAGED